MLRELRAPNPSAMTLDGTRTWLIGEREVAIIDPGPLIDAHIDAIARETTAAGASITAILLTHLHPDHADAAEALATRLNAPVHAIGWGSLHDGDVIWTDNGELITLHSPGHTPDHASFHWPATNALFCGDLMMGGMDTALVAPPEGDLGDYLHSLERLRALGPAVIHPAHGPSFDHPLAAIDRYVAHRAARQQQVLDALSAGIGTAATIAGMIYGATIQDELHDVAVGAAAAYLEHLERAGEVVRDGEHWLLRAD